MEDSSSCLEGANEEEMKFKAGDRLIQFRHLSPGQSKYVTVISVNDDNVRHTHDGETRTKNCSSDCFREIDETGMHLAIQEALAMLGRNKS